MLNALLRLIQRIDDTRVEKNGGVTLRCTAPRCNAATRFNRRTHSTEVQNAMLAVAAHPHTSAA